VRGGVGRAPELFLGAGHPVAWCGLGLDSRAARCVVGHEIRLSARAMGLQRLGHMGSDPPGPAVDEDALAAPTNPRHRGRDLRRRVSV
jgi:hypothetical protein